MMMCFILSMLIVYWIIDSRLRLLNVIRLVMLWWMNMLLGWVMVMIFGFMWLLE